MNVIRYFFLFKLIISSFVVNGQDVILLSQSDVDAFDQNVTSIDGDLIIGEYSTITDSDIVDLSNLSNITSVDGQLYIGYNYSLTNVDGLSHISTVGGDFTLIYNRILPNIDGLSGITSIGNNILLHNNSTLESLDGLSNLASDINDLEISENDELINIDGLSNINSVSGSLIIERNFKLITLDGLTNLSEVGGTLQVVGNLDLNSLEGLSNITAVNGSLRLVSLPSISTLSDLSSINTVGGGIEIVFNSSLTNLEGLSNITSMGGNMRIYGNPSLVYLSGFPSITSVTGNLSITDNDQLISLEELVSLTFIGGGFSIEDNASLVNVNGLSSITEAGSISITNNPSLTNIDGFSSLASCKRIYLVENTSLTNINGFSGLTELYRGIIISDNTILTNLDGFQNTLSVGGDIIIENNPSLVSIAGLSNIDDLTFMPFNHSASIEIIDNHALTNLTGLHNITSFNNVTIENNSNLTRINLSSLTTVENDFKIEHNDAIIDLDGLSNLTLVEGDFAVRYNFSLANGCGIQDLLSDPDGVEGFTAIQFNAFGCNTKEEILNDVCELQILVGAQPPCIGVANGELSILVQGYDDIPFLYEWEQLEDGLVGSGVSNEDYFNIGMLVEGTYNITVTNGSIDSAIQEGIVLSAIDGSIFEIIEIQSTNSSNGLSNGAIEVEVSGGTLPYSLSWTGPSSGAESNITTKTFSLPNLIHGEYMIQVIDAVGEVQDVEVVLLDETIAVFPCQEPLDIVILNDVSGSVDAIEYTESKQFFVDFINEINVGVDSENSRVGIIEWSSASDQAIRIPITGDHSDIQNYINLERVFNGGTNPHEAMQFGKDYLDIEAREGVEKVLVLSTDGYLGQVSPSLIALADEFKADGYHIVTVAFDGAFSSEKVREILKEVASVNVLAPGAPAYSELMQELAKNIINLYVCPIDPGSSATAYFNRDGAIEIVDIVTLDDCPNPQFIDLTFTLEALRELSIPAGTSVTFYHNDPNLFGATHLLTWQVPCAISIGTVETFTITLPVNGPSEIYAVFNDDGSSTAPLQFPITNLSELAYSNNIDSERFCVDQVATLQASMYSTTPIPACDTTVNYTVNVCNISEVDAYRVEVLLEVPNDFELISSVVNDNGCSTEVNDAYNIPEGCCVSIIYSYDAADASFNYYGNQNVTLRGKSPITPLMANQVYYDYIGSNSTDEDVIIDGTINCPSSVIEFTKSVNLDESCDDGFLIYTYTINNEMNIPLQGLTFLDEVSMPASWVYQTYDQHGLSISDVDLDGTVAEFTISQVDANTVASFSLDASLGIWPSDGIVGSSANLSNVPDPINGGLTTLTSNLTNTQIFASPQIVIDDTIRVEPNVDTLAISSIINTTEGILWTSSGDGTFTDLDTESTNYVFGDQDKVNEEVSLFVTVESDCNEVGENIVVIIDEMVSTIDELKLKDKYSAVPNPSYGELTVTPLESVLPYHMEIYNSNGTLIRKYVNDNNQSINTDLGHLAPGLYLLSIVDKKGSNLIKWVKL